MSKEIYKRVLMDLNYEKIIKLNKNEDLIFSLINATYDEYDVLLKTYEYLFPYEDNASEFDDCYLCCIQQQNDIYNNGVFLDYNQIINSENKNYLYSNYLSDMYSWASKITFDSIFESYKNNYSFFIHKLLDNNNTRMIEKIFDLIDKAIDDEEQREIFKQYKRKINKEDLMRY